MFSCLQVLPLVLRCRERSMNQYQRNTAITFAHSYEYLADFRIDARFEVGPLIWSGDTSSICLVRHRDFPEQLLAMKILHPYLALDAASVETFKNEVLAAYSVTHRNIVRAHEYVVSNGFHFFTMEYIAESSITSSQNENMAFQSLQLYNFIENVAAGVKAIHNAGLIHGNLHNDNVLFNSSGLVKILDFGEATRSQGSLGDSFAASNSELQMHSDERLDIFSIGLMAFELASGRVLPKNLRKALFTTEGETVHKLLSVSRLTCAPALISIIETCLKLDPDERFQNIDELCSDLKRAAVRLAFPVGDEYEERTQPRLPVAVPCGLPSVIPGTTVVEDILEPAVEQPNLFLRDHVSQSVRFRNHLLAALCFLLLLIGMFFPVGEAISSNIDAQNTNIRVGNSQQMQQASSVVSDVLAPTAAPFESINTVSPTASVVANPIAAPSWGEIPTGLRPGWYVQFEDSRDSEIRVTQIVPLVTDFGIKATLQVKKHDANFGSRLFAGPVPTNNEAETLCSRLRTAAKGTSGSVLQIRSVNNVLVTETVDTSC